ncbi:MAG: TetR/AcrR family transcriptional regulator [Burkholderiaceae bacterium]
MIQEVSSASADAHGSRSDEILALVRPVLATQGFDGASMQQLARAAGMSAGNFYRYFPSKDAIIAALVERDLRELEEDFAQIRASADPRATFRSLIRRRVAEVPCEMAPMMLETEAAAMRRPEIGALLAHMDRAIERNLLALFRVLGAGPEVSDAVLLTRVRLIMMLVKGMMRRTVPEGAGAPTAADSAALAELVLQTIESIVQGVLGQVPAARSVVGVS